MAYGLHQGGSGLLAGTRSSSNRVAQLAPKHAAGRVRRAMRVSAMARVGGSSFMGQRVARAAPGMAPSRKVSGRGKGLVVRAMFERFTEKAIKVVMLAQEEARRLGHNFVGTEQILLGLIGESTGIAAKVLKSMGVNLKDARVEVEKIIGRGSGFVAVEIPFTPRAKRVLELSLEEARQLGEQPGSMHGGVGGLGLSGESGPPSGPHHPCSPQRPAGLTTCLCTPIMAAGHRQNQHALSHHPGSGHGRAGVHGAPTPFPCIHACCMRQATMRWWHATLSQTVLTSIADCSMHRP